MTFAGTVTALWRFPVKSMLGERPESVQVTAAGLAGDRAYAIIDAVTGKIASAKHPRLWPDLLGCRAAFTELPLEGSPLPLLTVASSPSCPRRRHSTAPTSSSGTGSGWPRCGTWLCWPGDCAAARPGYGPSKRRGDDPASPNSHNQVGTLARFASIG